MTMSDPVVGIVAEYNPLHLGHLHHLRAAREKTGARAAVVVMSPCFVQRGRAALLDKRTRARSAILAGADLVVELPTVFATHNAGVFANAAVDILASAGVVSHICFGVESPDWHTDRILNILIDEPEAFKRRLKELLAEGCSFVESRSLALDELVPGSADKLRKPNNNLALAYMLRLKEKNYPIKPLPIERIGAMYHDTEPTEYASSTAVRGLIFAGKGEKALSLIPDFSAELLSRALKNGRAVTDETKMWNILRAALLRLSAEELSKLSEIGEGIENRLKREALESRSFDEWSSRCSSKRYPRGRIQRQGLHIMLGLGHWTNRAFQRNGPAYLRVLAMNGKGRELLREMKTKAKLPVITVCGDAKSHYAAEMMRFETLAAELWEQLVPNGEFGEEHKRKIIIM